MNIFEWLTQFPEWFQMIMAALPVFATSTSILLIFSRKIKIDKTGVLFDRLRKKPERRQTDGENK